MRTASRRFRARIERGHYPGLVADGVFAICGLSRQAEALEVQGEDPVVRSQGRTQKPPGIGGGPEAVEEDNRRPLARVVVIDLEALIIEGLLLAPGLGQFGRGRGEVMASRGKKEQQTNDDGFLKDAH